MLNLHSEYEGEFLILATDSATGRTRVVADWFPNLITNNGLNAIGEEVTYVEQCYLGTGSAAPTYEDSQMDALLARKSYTYPFYQIGTNPTTPYFGWTTYRYMFDTGEVVGNLTEIGIGWLTNWPESDTEYKLFARTLIKNESGVPIAVTVLETEAVTIFYKVKQYAPVGDHTYNVVISGTEYTMVTRASSTLQSGNWYPQAGAGSIDARVNNGGLEHPETNWYTGSFVSSITWEPYVLDSFERSFNAVWDSFTANDHAGGIIRTVCLSKHGTYQTSISPAIPKVSPKELGLTYKFSWSRRA